MRRKEPANTAGSSSFSRAHPPSPPSDPQDGVQVRPSRSRSLGGRWTERSTSHHPPSLPSTYPHPDYVANMNGGEEDRPGRSRRSSSWSMARHVRNAARPPEGEPVDATSSSSRRRSQAAPSPLPPAPALHHQQAYHNAPAPPPVMMSHYYTDSGSEASHSWEMNPLRSARAHPRSRGSSEGQGNAVVRVEWPQQRIPGEDESLSDVYTIGDHSTLMISTVVPPSAGEATLTDEEPEEPAGAATGLPPADPAATFRARVQEEERRVAAEYQMAELQAPADAALPLATAVPAAHPYIGTSIQVSSSFEDQSTLADNSLPDMTMISYSNNHDSMMSDDHSGRHDYYAPPPPLPSSAQYYSESQFHAYPPHPDDPYSSQSGPHPRDIQPVIPVVVTAVKDLEDGPRVVSPQTASLSEVAEGTHESCDEYFLNYSYGEHLEQLHRQHRHRYPSEYGDGMEDPHEDEYRYEKRRCPLPPSTIIVGPSSLDGKSPPPRYRSYRNTGSVTGWSEGAGGLLCSGIFGCQRWICSTRAQVIVSLVIAVLLLATAVAVGGLVAMSNRSSSSDPTSAVVTNPNGLGAGRGGTPSPSLAPSLAPVAAPVAAPSLRPVGQPPVATIGETTHPSIAPSTERSAGPSFIPSLAPSVSNVPSRVPSLVPSVSSVPSRVPSLAPTAGPSRRGDTASPSDQPSQVPSRAPVHPSARPSQGPTALASARPTPLPAPSQAPSSDPSATPPALPQGCGVDDPTRLIYAGSQFSYQTCSWLSQRPVQARKLCTPGSEAYQVCPVTCGNCDSARPSFRPVVRPTPRPTPTSLQSLIVAASPGTATAFQNVSSPQAQALQWVLNQGYDRDRSSSAAMQMWTLAAWALQTDYALWTRNDGWLANSNECSWFGVRCDSSNRVVALNATKNGLTGALLPEVSLLASSLTSLDVSNNRLTGSLPGRWGSLTNLQRLDLGENSLMGSLPTYLGLMTNLRQLYLEWNNISGRLPSEITQLTQLEALQFYRNVMTGAVPTGLCQMTTLNDLQLDCWEVQCDCWTMCWYQCGGNTGFTCPPRGSNPNFNN